MGGLELRKDPKQDLIISGSGMGGWVHVLPVPPRSLGEAVGQVEMPSVKRDSWEVGVLDQREAGRMGKLSGC